MPTRTTLCRRAGAFLLAGLLLATVCACTQHPKPRTTIDPNLPAEERQRRENAIREADRAFRENNPEEAERLYMSAIKMYPDFGQAWNNLGVVLMSQSRFLEAGEAFDRAADLEPTDPRPPYNRGLLWFDRGYLRESMPFFLESLERDPNYLPALRSAVRASILLRETSEMTLQQIKRAMLIETDQQWRDYFERQRLLIEAGLSNKVETPEPNL
jgi:tetratricopeptide (TPR) repeat protein